MENYVAHPRLMKSPSAGMVLGDALYFKLNDRAASASYP